MTSRKTKARRARTWVRIGFSKLEIMATSAAAFLSAAGIATAQEEPILTPYFERVTDTAFPPAACDDPDNPGALGCYTSWMVLSDIDADGDLDLLFANGGGYYVPGNAEPSTVYLNDGNGAFRDVTDSMFGGATSRLRQVSLGDIDGDGDLDIFQPGGYGLDYDKLWIQTSPGVFEDRADLNLPGRLKSTAGASHFGDLDGDGDLDLVIADWGDIPYNRDPLLQSEGNTWLYLNDGDGRFAQQPSYVMPAPMDRTVGRTPIDIDLADIDGDFDLDILLNNRNGQSRIFLNDGGAFFTDATEGNYPAKKGPYTYNQELCDLDGDGDLDMVLDNAAARPEGETRRNWTQMLLNDGNGKFDDVSREHIFGEPGADDNAVKCADVDGDGDYDLLVASLGGTGEKLLLNDGNMTFNFVLGGFPVLSDPSLGIDVADLNGDGILDVVTGQGEGRVMVDQIFFGAGESKADVTPPVFRAIEQPVAVPGAPIVVRLGVRDAYTSETGEHVKSVSVSYSVDGAEPVTVPAYFIGGDLFRAEIPAQANGTVLKVSPVAVDRVNLTSADASFELLVGTVVEPEPGTGDGDGDGDGDVGGDGDGDEAPAPGDGDGDESETPAPGDGDGDGDEVPAPGGDGDGATVPSSSDDGCSVGHSGSRSNGLVLLGLFALLLRRLRRRGPHVVC